MDGPNITNSNKNVQIIANIINRQLQNMKDFMPFLNVLDVVFVFFCEEKLGQNNRHITKTS